MAKAHKDSVLAAACIQTPVNPHTRGPITLYERQEEERQRLTSCKKHQEGDELDSYSDTDANMWNSSDWVLDIAKLSHSDKEYYLQLKKLKCAHLHNMEQLEEMYENKLQLKGVQNTEPDASKGARAIWEPKHPTEFDCYFLKKDIGLSISPGLSEAEAFLDEMSDSEDDNDTQSSTSAREKIGQMWNGFILEDYIKDSRFVKERSKHQNKSKAKEWSHRITIPQPFQMTIRESKKKEMDMKSKSEIEMENNLLKKRLEEEAECQKKFRANPVPASVYLPLYHEIVERNDERRKFVKEKSKDILLSSQRPFNFNDREEHKKQVRKLHLAHFSDAESNFKHFKAKPVPKSIYGTSVNERLKEEKLYREIRIHMRSQELLHSSFYPTSTLAGKSSKTRCYEPEEEKHRPKINRQVPNFQVLHQGQQKRLKNKSTKNTTICDPFNLQTANISSNKDKILKDIEKDEQMLKETRWPYKSPRNQTQKTLLPCTEAPAVSPKSTESSKRREQAIRKSVEDKIKEAEEEKKRQAKKKQREKILRKHISRKAKAIHPEQAQKPHSKLKELRQNEKRRIKEYMQELEEMKERVSQTPLLLERATQRNARLYAEKHYSNVLRDLGLSDDFVSSKGQTATLQDPGHTKKDELSSDDDDDDDMSSTEGTLEMEDLQGDDDEEVYSNLESEDEKQEDYSTDEDHSEDIC